MKINSYTQTPIYKFSQKSDYNISKKLKDNTSFGNYLDDELEQAENALGGEVWLTKHITAENNKKIATNTNTLRQKQAEIENRKAEQEKLFKHAKRISEDVTQKDELIIKLHGAKNFIIGEIEAKEQEETRLKQAEAQVLEQIEKDRITAAQELQRKIAETNESATDLFKRETQAFLYNAKSTLTQRVVAPTKLESQERKTVVPGGVLLESKPSEAPRKITEWLAKTTNSNYAVVDVSEFKENRPRFLKRLTDLAQKAKKDFDKTKRRTFTFIDNFWYYASPSNDNRPIIGALKSYLDTCSTEYHNTIVVASEDPAMLDPIVSADHRFPVKVKLDSEFMSHNNFGYPSMLKEIKEAKSAGREFKPPLISRLFRGIFR